MSKNIQFTNTDKKRRFAPPFIKRSKKTTGVWSALQKTRGEKKTSGGRFQGFSLVVNLSTIKFGGSSSFHEFFWGAENNTIQLKLHRKMFFLINKPTRTPRFTIALSDVCQTFELYSIRVPWIFLLLQKRSATEYPRIRKLWSWPPM